MQIQPLVTQKQKYEIRDKRLQAKQQDLFEKFFFCHGKLPPIQIGFSSMVTLSILKSNGSKSVDVDISESYWTPEENEALTRGYGQWHDLGKGYKVRVDRPHGSNDTKPHVHVKKGNKDVTENVDGSNSHGTNMTRGGVPKDIQKKVKGLNDYKKAQKDLKSMNAARSKIKARKLNMKKTADIIIAIGIFIAVVGFAIFAASAIASWGAFFLVFI